MRVAAEPGGAEVVVVGVCVPFGVLSFRDFVLVGRECVRVGGGPKASLALGLTRRGR